MILDRKHIAVVGLGSGGSALADMLARAGVDRLTMIDPDELTRDNTKRHVLTRMYCGWPKVMGMGEHIFATNPKCITTLIIKRFNGLTGKPNLIACCADSDACCQLVNQYALEQNIPAVYGGVHGEAEVAEIISVVPGETPCYACYEREGPTPEPGQEKYTNPDYDATKMPHQEGLWADVLMAASIQFRAILGVFEGKPNPLMLVPLRPPYGAKIIRQERGCPVCSDNMQGLMVERD